MINDFLNDFRPAGEAGGEKNKNPKFPNIQNLSAHPLWGTGRMRVQYLTSLLISKYLRSLITSKL